MARICVVGDWHQATVVGACLAEVGHEVRGAVGSADVAERFNAGQPPVHEPDLPVLMQRGLDAGRLSYTAVLGDALRHAEFVVLALDTPVGDDDAPRLDVVVDAAQQVGRALEGDTVLIVTAQVPAGTCERLRQYVAGRSGYEVGLAYVPEFLRLGRAVHTFMNADRFVIGCDDDDTAAAVAAVYAPLGRPQIRMSVSSAEMAKHACNAFLAVSISLANELADLCGEAGADIDDVTRAMRLDPRIGEHAYLNAGLGFAGGTLGRDLRALQGLGRLHGLSTAVVDAAYDVNRTRAKLVHRLLRTAYDEVRGLHVGVLGLTYKPGTSTMRRSIALEIIRDLVARGATVAAYDPLADMADVVDPPPFVRARDPYAAAAGADALVLVTPWDGLADVDMRAMAAQMRRPVLIDTHNHFEPDALVAIGFRWLGVGRAARPRDRQVRA
jgi:UDPglucose 6-dehydrogenase